MMSEELHPVVKLLLARLESHPDEFALETDVVEADSIQDRWWQVVRDIREYGTEEERAALAVAMREVRLQKTHEMMMDELCNGEERRRKAREQRELERQEYMAQQAKAYSNHPGAASLGNLYNSQLQSQLQSSAPGLLGVAKKALGLGT